MYKEIKEVDLQKRLKLIDNTINSEAFSYLSTIELLNFIHTLFPLEYVMNSEFKGNHCILMEDSKVKVLIWCNDSLYSVTQQ